MSQLNRWSPFEESLSLRDAMNRLFEDSFVASAATATRSGNLGIEMNVSEHENGFMVEAALPGIQPDDLEITVQDNILKISGELRQQAPAQGTITHRTERRYGRFTRSLALPTLVKSDAVTANLEHGILRLEIPKAESVKPRKIAVQVNAGNTQRSLDGTQTNEVGK